MTPLRPCRTCRRPFPDGNCPAHPKKGAYRPERPRHYGPFWRRLVAAVLAAAGHLCEYCHRPARSGDHVIPLSRGGATTRDNVVAACRHCNTSKGNRTLAEWIASGCAPAPAMGVLRARIKEKLPV